MKYGIKNIENKIIQLQGKNKIDLLNELSNQLEVRNPKRALELGKEALKLSRSLNYEKGIAWSLMRIAYSCRRLSYYEEGITYLFESVKIFKELKDDYGEGRALNLLGIYFFYYGSYDEALKYCLKALQKSRKIENNNLETGALNNIGEIYREQEKYEEALQYYFENLDLMEKGNNKRAISAVLINVGSVYHELGKDSCALEYLEKSLKLTREINERIYESECLNKIGEIYHKKNQYEKALEYYNTSQKIIDECENKFYSIDILVNLGKVYFQTEIYNKALENFQSALLIAEKINANKKIYIIHFWLFKYYEKKGVFENALFHYKKYDRIQKQITTEELEKKLKVLTIENELEKAQKEAEIYRLKNIELKKKNEEIQLKAKELKENKDKLELMEKSRKELLSNISHDLRTPITSIQGYVEAMQDGLISTEESRKKYLERIHFKVLTLKRLMEDLFQLSNLELKQLKFFFKDIKVNDLIQNIHDKYELDVKKYNRKLLINECSNDAGEAVISIDAVRIDQVFGNIIFNSLKYANKSDFIKIGYEKKSSEEVVIKIEDNGVGIAEEDLECIFERFYKGKKSREPSNGSGLGLSISREIIRYHKGEIWVENNLHKGCTFYFTLPIKKS